jgi:hypothetical protein
MRLTGNPYDRFARGALMSENCPLFPDGHY